MDVEAVQIAVLCHIGKAEERAVFFGDERMTGAEGGVPCLFVDVSRRPGVELFFGIIAAAERVYASIKEVCDRGKVIRSVGPQRHLRSFKVRYTMRTAMSAGLTPEMRSACPRLRGRMRASFSRASRRSPSMCS